jgi:hypothetical protein
MVHRIKCDGEILIVPAGNLDYVMAHLPPLSNRYRLKDGGLDYKALKSDVKLSIVPSDVVTHASIDVPALLEFWGYLDFDQMEKQRKDRPVPVGLYYSNPNNSNLSLTTVI